MSEEKLACRQSRGDGDAVANQKVSGRLFRFNAVADVSLICVAHGLKSGGLRHRTLHHAFFRGLAGLVKANMDQGYQSTTSHRMSPLDLLQLQRSERIAEVATNHR